MTREELQAFSREKIVEGQTFEEIFPEDHNLVNDKIIQFCLNVFQDLAKSQDLQALDPASTKYVNPALVVELIQLYAPGSGDVPWKRPVLVASLTNIPLFGEQTIQGVATNKSRILLCGQNNAAMNGIWISDINTWLRASDNNTADKILNSKVPVQRGTFAGSVYKCTNTTLPTLGTTNIAFEEQGGNNESNSLYKGKFSSLSALQSAFPSPVSGWNALIDDDNADGDVQEYIVDTKADGVKQWKLGTGTTVTSTDSVTEGSNNLYFTFNRVRNSLLTGVSFLTSTAIAATDTVLTAFGKLQAQITAETKRFEFDLSFQYGTEVMQNYPAASTISSVVLGTGLTSVNVIVNGGTPVNAVTATPISIPAGANVLWRCVYSGNVAQGSANVNGTKN